MKMRLQGRTKEIQRLYEMRQKKHAEYVEYFDSYKHMNDNDFEILVRAWSIEVKMTAQRKCELCEGDAVNAHHINPRVKHPDLTLSKDNGIAVCKKCHSKCQKIKRDYVITRAELFKILRV